MHAVIVNKEWNSGRTNASMQYNIHLSHNHTHAGTHADSILLVVIISYYMQPIGDVVIHTCVIE